MEFATLFTNTLAFTTLAGNLGLLGLLLLFLLRRSIVDRLLLALGAHALWLSFVISLGAVVGSIIYSEVVGFPACILCWMQRIFMYPVPFLYGLALVRRERVIFPYTLFLALIGGAIGCYHWVKDMLLLYGSVNMACPEVAGLPSCDKIYVLEFGYITIAMISLNAFLWLAFLAWAGIRAQNNA